jgi:hypothetical protein
MNVARWSLRILPLVLLASVGCSDSEDSTPTPDAATDAATVDATDAGADTTPESDGSNVDAVTIPAPPEGGVTLRFEAEAGPWEGDGFYAFPWPSDLRMDPDGTIAIEGIPQGSVPAILPGIVETAGEMRGFSSLPVAWLAFDGAPQTPDPNAVTPATPDADVLLINIDPDSPRRLSLTPTTARLLEPDDYTPENVLGVSAWPGFVLEPATTYAFVVRRTFGDDSGSPLGSPALLWNVLHGDPESPESLRALYAPLTDALSELGVGPDEVAAATVFTTADVVTELHELTERVRARYAPEIENLRVDPTDGASHERFCEMFAELTIPEFQAGAPPFDRDGLLVIDDAGEPVEQSQTTIPVVIVMPNMEMPAAGYPLAMYFHGSGGVAEQLVQRGPILEPGGPETPGEGPAFELAALGIGSAGSAHPVNPERLPGATATAYLNFNNLKSFRDIFRQGAIEQRLYLDALLRLEVAPEQVATCTGLSLPAGETAYRFDPNSVVAMGQSMGGMYTNIVGAVEPRISAVVPTGAGGYWSYFILETSLIPGIRRLVGALLDTDVELSAMHPVLHALQTAWEPVEPLVYMPRLGRNPLEGHPNRPIYEPIGKDDEYFPTSVYDAVILAYQHPQAGETVWARMQEMLALADLDGIVAYPVRDNVTALDGGAAFTSVGVQYEGDGIADPHGIYAQLDAVKYQYGCFFASFLRDGTATVPAPAELGTPCP